jgi:hypothetical protein
VLFVCLSVTSHKYLEVKPYIFLSCAINVYGQFYTPNSFTSGKYFPILTTSCVYQRSKLGSSALWQRAQVAGRLSQPVHGKIVRTQEREVAISQKSSGATTKSLHNSSSINPLVINGSYSPNACTRVMAMRFPELFYYATYREPCDLFVEKTCLCMFRFAPVTISAH